jgi:hypothetical protein
VANPKQEAYEKLAGEFEVRVLEPSPPAVTEPPWTDDPVNEGEVYDGRLVVSPIPNGDLSWDVVAAEQPEIADWCAERWLGAYKRLEPLPSSFAVTRAVLHEVAIAVVAPARKPEKEISLRYTRGGFGTPFYEQDGEDCQVRVEHAMLIRQRGDTERTEALPGEVTEASATALGDFYGFACSILEELRHENADINDRVRLWPEHFDIAVDLGPETARATYGASPGDDDHDEPYLYVLPLADVSPGELWNATGFNGAELPYAELLEADDQRLAALRFMRERSSALDETGRSWRSG